MSEDKTYDAIVDHRLKGVPSMKMVDPFLGDVFSSFLGAKNRKYINSMWSKEQNEEFFIFRIPALGCTIDDLDITYSGDILSVELIPSAPKWEISGGSVGAGNVLHQFDLGGLIKADDIVAHVHVGFLILHLPKEANVTPRKIPVSDKSIKVEDLS